MTLILQPNQWNKVEMVFDGYRLKGIVTSELNGKPVQQIRTEPLMGTSVKLMVHRIMKDDLMDINYIWL
jgi:hypothetical protein